MSAVSFDDAREALARRVGVDALAHCERVAVTAGHIAEVYGVDEDVARLAGLLHDWGRDDGPTSMLEAAEQRGLEVTDVDRDRPYLLHAHTAAAELRTLMPGLPQEVLSAVESHTMGALEMSDLDRIVYIADMIEPARTHPAVDEIRAAVGFESLNQLFFRAYAASIRSLVDRKALIHPRTIAVWNRLVKRSMS